MKYFSVYVHGEDNGAKPVEHRFQSAPDGVVVMTNALDQHPEGSSVRWENLPGVFCAELTGKPAAVQTYVLKQLADAYGRCLSSMQEDLLKLEKVKKAWGDGGGFNLVQACEEL